MYWQMSSLCKKCLNILFIPNFKLFITQFICWTSTKLYYYFRLDYRIFSKVCFIKQKHLSVCKCSSQTSKCVHVQDLDQDLKSHLEGRSMTNLHWVLHLNMHIHYTWAAFFVQDSGSPLVNKVLRNLIW